MDIDPSYGRLVERDSEELPIGRSADPEIDGALRHASPGRERTSGASLLGEAEEWPKKDRGGPLEEIWNAAPALADDEQTEGYDAVAAEDLGAVWLERATQTTRQERPYVEESLGEGFRISSLPPDESEEEDADDEIDLGEWEPPSHRVSSR